MGPTNKKLIFLWLSPSPPYSLLGCRLASRDKQNSWFKILANLQRRREYGGEGDNQRKISFLFVGPISSYLGYIILKVHESDRVSHRIPISIALGETFNIISSLRDLTINYRPLQPCHSAPAVMVSSSIKHRRFDKKIQPQSPDIWHWKI